MDQKELMLGIIGGSGIYEIPTPYGDPSDEIYIGVLNNIKVAFLPRHGRGHVYSPSTVPYRANLYAMKYLGVTDILAISVARNF